MDSAQKQIQTKLNFFKKEIKKFDNRNAFMWILFSPNKYAYERKCLRPLSP